MAPLNDTTVQETAASRRPEGKKRSFTGAAVILAAVAVGIGLLATGYALGRLAAEQDVEPPPVQQEKVKFLVAKTSLGCGFLLRDPKKHFEEKTYHKGQEPGRPFTSEDYALLKGRMLMRAISAGDFVRAKDLLDTQACTPYVGMPPGPRAVALKVRIKDVEIKGVAYCHNRADIEWVMRRAPDGGQSSCCLMRNVLVLGVDEEEGSRRPNDDTRLVTVTVALPPEESELVALAQEKGKLRLVMRGSGNSSLRIEPAVDARARALLDRHFNSSP